MKCLNLSTMLAIASLNNQRLCQYTYSPKPKWYAEDDKAAFTPKRSQVIKRKRGKK